MRSKAVRATARWKATVVLGVLLNAATAQPPGGDNIWTPSIEGRTTYLASGDANGDAGLNVLISELIARVSGSPWYGSIINIDAGWTERHYDPDPDLGLGAPGRRNPFIDAHQFSANARVIQGINREWGVLLAGGVRASAEVGADHLDGITWNALAGVGYQFSPELRLGVGAIALGRLEEDVLVVPAIQFDWRFNETWRLRLEGPALELTWQPSEDWTLGLGARWDSARFRLADDEFPTDGIFEDQRIPVTLRARHAFTEDIWGELTVSVDAWRRLAIEDSGGDRIRSFTADPGVAIGIAVGITF